MKDIPIWEKYTLTVREASAYLNIGEKRLRQIIEENNSADFLILNGNRGMIKRKHFERFIDESSII